MGVKRPKQMTLEQRPAWRDGHAGVGLVSRCGVSSSRAGSHGLNPPDVPMSWGMLVKGHRVRGRVMQRLGGNSKD